MGMERFSDWGGPFFYPPRAMQAASTSAGIDLKLQRKIKALFVHYEYI